MKLITLVEVNTAINLNKNPIQWLWCSSKEKELAHLIEKSNISLNTKRVVEFLTKKGYFIDKG